MQNRLLIIFFTLSISTLFGAGRPEEAEIPMPEIQYDLPDDLIGEFVLINYFNSSEITIYPNNKFITRISVPLHMDRYESGYIVKKDDRWYLVPLDTYLYNRPSFHAFLSDLTEIIYTDNGYTFYDKRDEGLMYIMHRKVDISRRQNIAEDISIGLIRVRRQYYIYKQSNIQQLIDFNEIHEIEIPLAPIRFFHELVITNGYIEIRRRGYQIGYDNIGFPFLWEGFVEIHEENENMKKGIIKFTNGIPYYYIKNGTAIIEINNEKRNIIMECTTEVEEMVREKIPDAESPVYLVFEF